MRVVTNLMDRIFSDSTPEEFKDKVSEKIDEAKANGSAELKDGDTHLSFAESNGDVVIEDKKNDNEVTIAKEDNGEYKLEGVPTTKTQSATEPDVKPVIPAGTTKAPLKPDATLADAHEDIKAEVVSEEKAGIGKHFSVVVTGFGSEESAQKFYSNITTEGKMISFSESEVECKAQEANELKELAERVEGTKDPELAAELKTKAESLKAYSVLAAGQGFDMGDLYEASTMYSDYADEVLNTVYSEMDVNEFFSDLSEDEVTAYFSGLDEVEANILYSAMTDEENNYTFSDVQEAINECYSELELNTPIQEYFSEYTEDEINSFFSSMNEDEANLVFSMLEENENVTFSEVNAALELYSTPMNQLFSDMTEEEIKAYSDEVGTDAATIAFSMAVDEENYTYSDFLDVMEYMTTYSDEDVDQLSKNTEEIGKAVEDMKSSEDPELAKKVKVLADATAEEAEKAEEQGMEKAKELCDKCHSYSEAAEDILVKNGINPKSVDAEKVMDEVAEAKKAAEDAKKAEAAAKEAEDKAAQEAAKAAEEAKKAAEAEQAAKAAEEAKKAEEAVKVAAEKKDEGKTSAYSYLFESTENRTFSTKAPEGEQRVFGKVNATGGAKTVNPCLFTSIN